MKRSVFINSFCLLLCSSLLLENLASAMVDQPVTWADMSAVDLRPVFDSPYATEANLMDPFISPSSIDLVLRDADARVSKSFQVPPALKDSVEFWLKIYTQYTTQQVLLFDERHPQLVYEVIDFRDLAKTSRNRVVYEILSERRVKKTVASYRRAFEDIRRNRNRKKWGPIHQRILAVTARVGHKHTLAEMEKNLRTQTGQRDNIMKGLVAAEAFFPKMEEIFEQFDVPRELTRLSLVESSFNLKAISRVGATGVWQFMLASGKEFMIVEPHQGIDERLSPLKSTVAAAKLLRRNKRILGSWPLSVTSYNHGIRNLMRLPAVERREDRVHRVFDPCSKTSPLGYASRNYYSGLLAVIHAEAYRHLFYGEAPIPQVKPIRFHKVKRGETAIAVARAQGVPLEELRALNPDLKNYRMKLPRNYLLALPGERDDLTALLTLPNPSPVRRATRRS